jgi:[ribosomal protein S5]-alanine N-acetyltransferase
MLSIATSRLNLVPATLALLNAELESLSALALHLRASVPDEWPPGEYDRSAIEYFRSRLAENPDEVGWYGWYALLRLGAVEPSQLVGAGGFFGPPNAEGLLEIGYSVVHQFSGRVRQHLEELVF